METMIRVKDTRESVIRMGVIIILIEWEIINSLDQDHNSK